MSEVIYPVLTPLSQCVGVKRGHLVVLSAEKKTLSLNRGIKWENKMDKGGKFIPGNTEIMLVTARAAARPVWTRDAVQHGDFWHVILSSQESRETAHKDWQHQKNMLEIILTVQEPAEILSSLFYPPGRKQHLPPCSNSVDFFEEGGTKESFCRTMR